MGATNMHERVVRILAQRPAGLVLDIPSGIGPLRDRVMARGHRIVGVDLFPTPNFQGVVADACVTFPFEDESFDIVLSMEGIEHFEDQTGFLRECARVLRPGGTLVLTTPNILHLSARVSAFFTGQRLMKHGFINEVSTLRHVDGERLYHGHAFLIDAFRLRYILRIVGMRLTDLHRTNVSTGSLLLSPSYPLIWLATRLSLRSGRRYRQRRGRSAPPAEVERDLARVALSPALLFSRGIVAVAEKDAGAADGKRTEQRE